MYAFAIGLWCIALLYLIAMLCMCRSIMISIAILEAAADFVASRVSIVFVPVFFFFINFAITFAWVVAAVCVFSIGEISSTPGS